MVHILFVWLLLLEVAAGVGGGGDAEERMLERSMPCAQVKLHFNGWAENAATSRGPQFDVTVTEDPNQIAHLDGCQLLVLHYANWNSPGLSLAAKAGLVGYLKRGGGLAVIPFSLSLPKSPDTN